jgi:hypothetical protein
MTRNRVETPQGKKTHTHICSLCIFPISTCLRQSRRSTRICFSKCFNWRLEAERTPTEKTAFIFHADFCRCEHLYSCLPDVSVIASVTQVHWALIDALLYEDVYGSHSSNNGICYFPILLITPWTQFIDNSSNSSTLQFSSSVRISVKYAWTLATG